MQDNTDILWSLLKSLATKLLAYLAYPAHLAYSLKKQKASTARALFLSFYLVGIK